MSHIQEVGSEISGIKILKSAAVIVMLSATSVVLAQTSTPLDLSSRLALLANSSLVNSPQAEPQNCATVPSGEAYFQQSSELYNALSNLDTTSSQNEALPLLAAIVESIPHPTGYFTEVDKATAPRGPVYGAIKLLGQYGGTTSTHALIHSIDFLEVPNMASRYAPSESLYPCVKALINLGTAAVPNILTQLEDDESTTFAKRLACYVLLKTLGRQESINLLNATAASLEESSEADKAKTRIRSAKEYLVHYNQVGGFPRIDWINLPLRAITAQEWLSVMQQ